MGSAAASRRDGTVAAGFVRGTNPPDLNILLGSWLCVDRGLHNSDAHLNLRFTRILKRPRTKWGRHLFPFLKL